MLSRDLIAGSKNAYFLDIAVKPRYDRKKYI
ncbi:palindromic element RPE4 domain-containing protein [Rickettsia sibirica]|nr:palindromic element RPE4 domain-containing protein [Rickettsia parkeri]